MNGAISYQYDAVGNRKQLTSTVAAIPATGLLNYDANDRISTQLYDNNGNTVNNGTLNVYDFENHLVQRGNVQIVYDGDGNRVSETVGGATVSYLVADVNPTGYPQVLQERQNQFGPILKNYEWGLQLIAEGDLSQSPLHYYGMDGHGSVRYLTDASGAITDTYDYDAFGNLIVSTGITANNYLFAGEQFDPALGVYYNRARYFDQRLGRFWSADTNEGAIGEPQSLHKYLYTAADPVDKIDPSGHDFGVVDFAVANSIATTINGAESNVGLSVINGFGSCAAAQTQGQQCDVTKASAIDLLRNAAFSFLFIAGVAVAGKLLGIAKQSVSLRFSQETASPFFSAEGSFAGETIGSLASKIKTGQVRVSQVPVQIVVRGNTALIVNNRSSLALLRAGVSQEGWFFENVTGQAFFEEQITQRLAQNGLSEEGTEVIRITGLGQNASNLQ